MEALNQNHSPWSEAAEKLNSGNHENFLFLKRWKWQETSSLKQKLLPLSKLFLTEKIIFNKRLSSSLNESLHGRICRKRVELKLLYA